MPNTEHLSGAGLLLPLTEEGHEPPLFLIPAAGSIPFSLARLARALSPKSSVYSFTFAGMEDNLTPHTSIEEMASTYVAEVKTIQQTGPYYLGGYCFGGIPAFEMAAQLEREGENVAVVIPIESFPPQRKKPEKQKEDHTDGQRGPPVSPTQAHDADTSITKQIDRQLSRIPTALRELHEEFTRRHLQMEDDYRATPIKAPIVEVRSSTYPRRLFEGWTALTIGGYTDRVVPVDTDSMLDPTNVAILCTELRVIVDHFH